MVNIKEGLLVIILCFMLTLFGLVIGGYILPTVSEDTDYLNTTDSDFADEKVESVYYDSELNLEEAQDGVVTIYAKKQSDDEVTSQGSGFLYTDKYIMTNEHVIAGTSKFYIQYNNGEWVEADLVGSDKGTDIAILEPDSVPNYAPVLPLQLKDPVIGEPVVAIGSPSSLDTTVTEGVVSATDLAMDIETEFTIPDTIQTDAALNPGNSGGPLISTTDGIKVIGVNRATDGENIGLAISANIAHIVGESIIEDGVSNRAYLGISTKDNDASIIEDKRIDSGVRISSIRKGSPFDRQTTFSNESFSSSPHFIVKIDDMDVNSSEQLYNYLFTEKEPDDFVDVHIYNQGNITVKSIKLDRRLVV